MTQARAVHAEVIVPADIESVWEAWTTVEGACTFFAPVCNVELRVNGAYEMLFDLEAAPGERGGEGMRILAFQPPAMLSFTWNAPPTLPSVRGQMTHVTVRLTALSDTETRVALTHDGWGNGGEWDQAFDYFSRAWGRVVLPRLRHRFAVRPIDWENPPQLPA